MHLAGFARLGRMLLTPSFERSTTVAHAYASCSVSGEIAVALGGRASILRAGEGVTFTATTHTTAGVRGEVAVALGVA